MTGEQNTKGPEVVLNLEEELTPGELESFQARADEAGLSLTDFFRRVFLDPARGEVERAGS